MNLRRIGKKFPMAQIYQCSCSPLERSVTLVTGDGLCEFYRIQDQTLKPVPTMSRGTRGQQQNI